MNTIKFQNYLHYKLPITTNPFEYGKLIEQFNNKYIMQLSTTNVVVINQINDENFVKFFRRGELMFEYKDLIMPDNTFIRTILDQKYTFKDNKLITTEISISNVLKTIYKSITPFSVNKFNIDSIFNWIDNSKDPIRAFLIWELCLILVLFTIFVILPDQFLNIDNNLTLASLSAFRYKKQFKSNWYSIFFNLDNQVFSVKLLEYYFDKFWKIVSPKLAEGSHIFILLKFQFEDRNFHTIGKLIRLDHNNYKNFITQIMNYMEGMGEYYNQSPVNKIIFSYGFKKGEILETFSNEEINLMNFKDMKFPISINPNDFGKIINKSVISEGNVYSILDHLGRTIIFKEFKNENLISYFKGSNLILEFSDKKIAENQFLRNLGKKSLFFEDGTKSLEISSILTPFISKLKKDKDETNQFITLDIETYGNKELKPYLISFYDGNKTYSFYLSDYGSIDLMMEACFKKLFVRKYHKHNIYVHNLVKFDIIFLLKYLIKHVKVDPLIHKGRIIQLTINYGPDLQYQISLKDSYLLLLASLSKLCKTFKVENQKSIFPHLFVSEDNLNYIGEVPTSNYFFNISENDYQNYQDCYSYWNLKNEAIKYCEIDCISLYQILLRFNSLIFENFNKNIHRYPTLPSLALAIFRSNFMENENIPKLVGNIEKDIRSGYTGGSTDVFIPKSEPGIKVKCYDVNSLYPSVMLNKDMPIGAVEKFEGNILNVNPNAFGFFYVKVKCPENILHPILQIKYKTTNGFKTISPVGSWSMWIFSEEMNNAKNYGYEFEIIKGYTFERGVTFKDYIDFLYNLRLQYSKLDPLNLIAKILMNSLYGRFGMSEILIKYEIFSKEDFKNIPEENITDFIEIEDHILVGLKMEDTEENKSNISIAIAAAITGYSRIHMSQFKNNSKINLYYTDTDSIYTDSELDKSYIDSKVLGKLKLEYEVDEAIFLGPKTYCLKLENEIIIKVKGLKDTSSLNYNDFNDLLKKESIKTISHSKWFRKLNEGQITIKDQLYTLIATENKRKFVFLNNEIVKTAPIILRQ